MQKSRQFKELKLKLFNIEDQDQDVDSISLGNYHADKQPIIPNDQEEDFGSIKRRFSFNKSQKKSHRKHELIDHKQKKLGEEEEHQFMRYVLFYSDDIIQDCQKNKSELNYYRLNGNLQHSGDKFIQQFRETHGIFFDFNNHSKNKNITILEPFTSDPSMLDSDRNRNLQPTFQFQPGNQDFQSILKKQKNEQEISSVDSKQKKIKYQFTFALNTLQSQKFFNQQKNDDKKSMLELTQFLEQNYISPDFQMIEKKLRRQKIEEIDLKINFRRQSTKKIQVKKENCQYSDEVPQNLNRQINFSKNNPWVGFPTRTEVRNSPIVKIQQKISLLLGQKKASFDMNIQINQKPNEPGSTQNPRLKVFGLQEGWGKGTQIAMQKMHTSKNLKENGDSERFSIKSESSIDSDDEIQIASKSDFQRINRMMNLINNKQSVGGKQLFIEDLIRQNYQRQNNSNHFVQQDPEESDASLTFQEEETPTNLNELIIPIQKDNGINIIGSQ